MLSQTLFHGKAAPDVRFSRYFGNGDCSGFSSPTSRFPLNFYRYLASIRHFASGVCDE